MKRAAEIGTSQLHSDIETGTTNDLTILRKPIKTSVTGLNEARKAFENGTEEVCVPITHFSSLIEIFITIYNIENFFFKMTLLFFFNFFLEIRCENCSQTNVTSFMNVRCVEICFEVWPIL